jgi:isopenicillin-N N-acyltransferase-like protein
LLFQNNDAFRSHLRHMAIVDYLDPVEHVQVTYAGVVGETGVSSNGIAVAGNSLETRIAGSGVPFTALIRKALEQETVDQAAALIEGTRRCAGMAYALAGADGEALYLETSGRHASRLTVGTRLLHTNHALSPVVAADECSPPARLQRSRRRLQAAQALIDSALEGEEQALTRLARDHGCDIDSVCQHVLDAADEVGAWQTLYSVIADPRARSLLLAEGVPCDAEFRRIEVLSRRQTRGAATFQAKE